MFQTTSIVFIKFVNLKRSLYNEFLFKIENILNLNILFTCLLLQMMQMLRKRKRKKRRVQKKKIKKIRKGLARNKCVLFYNLIDNVFEYVT